jgi:quinolinate synthase
MKKTDLQKVYSALETLRPVVAVPTDVAEKAQKAIEKMLAVW